MVRLICKGCGGNDFIREDDLYVCQHCGSKYTAVEPNNVKVEPLLALALGVIAKYINGVDSNGNCIEISEEEYLEANKYLSRVEGLDPGNWKQWFYRGILEELNCPSYFRQETFSSFDYFENAMKFADEIIIKERILPVVERLKQLMIATYIKHEGKWCSLPDYFPIFLYDYLEFYKRVDLAASYVQKTCEDINSLMPIVEKRQLDDFMEAKADKIKIIEKDLTTMNRYKNQMIECIAEINLYPKREVNLQNKINECKFYEVEKKSDLERRMRELGKSKKAAEDSVDKIKTKAYLLMKRNVDSSPARDIWEETFVRVVSDYVEKCYIEKEKPDQEDKDELNMKLFPIGFGIEYYMSHES